MEKEVYIYMKGKPRLCLFFSFKNLIHHINVSLFFLNFRIQNILFTLLNFKCHQFKLKFFEAFNIIKSFNFLNL